MTFPPFPVYFLAVAQIFPGCFPHEPHSDNYYIRRVWSQVKMTVHPFSVDEKLEISDGFRHTVVEIGSCIAHDDNTSVYYARFEGNEEVVIKFQSGANGSFQITTERAILGELNDLQRKDLCISEKLWYGTCESELNGIKYYAFITRCLGSDLYCVNNGEHHSFRNILLIAYGLNSILEELHHEGFLHHDIKPKNIVLGNQNSEDRLKITLIDFGICVKMYDESNKRIDAFQADAGTMPFMAESTHQCEPLGVRDDIESMVWTLLQMYLGKLPWDGEQDYGTLIQRKRLLKRHGLSQEIECSPHDPRIIRFFDRLLNVARKMDSDFSGSPPGRFWTRVPDKYPDEILFAPEGTEIFCPLLAENILELSQHGLPVHFSKRKWLSFSTGPIPLDSFIFVQNSERGVYFMLDRELHCNYLETPVSTVVEKTSLDGQKYNLKQYTEIRDIIKTAWQSKEYYPLQIEQGSLEYKGLSPAMSDYNEPIKTCEYKDFKPRHIPDTKYAALHAPQPYSKYSEK